MTTLSSLKRRLGVLADLTARYPELPAPSVDLGQIVTDRITLAFHDRPTALVQWAAALGIDLNTVTGRTNGDIVWLTVTFKLDGIALEFISYTRLAATVETGGEG